jgi:hypothetical protein
MADNRALAWLRVFFSASMVGLFVTAIVTIRGSIRSRNAH